MINHLAIVMDGNRRWARKQALRPWLGHQQGAQAVRKTIEWCRGKKIPHLSLYAFSLENFKRSVTEKQVLFSLLDRQINKNLPELIKNGVRVKFVGDRALFPKSLCASITRAEEETQGGTALNLHILFCYGGRQEIVRGAQQLLQRVIDGSFAHSDLAQLDEQTFREHLWVYHMPPPDLILRTGGRQRLSNMLLFDAAYAELYFIDTLWPEVTEGDLEKAYDYFIAVQRNYGL